MQALNLRCKISWVISNEEALIMRKIGIGDASIHNDVVIILDHVMFKETSACNHAEADVRLS